MAHRMSPVRYIKKHMEHCSPDETVPANSGWLRVPFGLRDGVLLDPLEVPNGLACGCKCPGCGARLIARNGGTERVAHFAHHGVSPGGDCYETAIHLKAKEVLLTARHILLPTYKRPLLRDEAGCEYKFPGWPRDCSWPYEKAAAEVHDPAFGARRPDAVLYGSAPLPRLLVEIRVHHAVDAQKKQTMVELELPMIEIDLRQIESRQLESTSFAELVLAKASNRHWISCPLGEQAYQEWEATALSKIAQVNAELKQQNRRMEEDRAGLLGQLSIPGGRAGARSGPYPPRRFRRAKLAEFEARCHRLSQTGPWIAICENCGMPNSPKSHRCCYCDSPRLMPERISDALLARCRARF